MSAMSVTATRAWWRRASARWPSSIPTRAICTITWSNTRLRLTATLPPALSVVFLTNSGSEANDLALRLVQAHVRARGTVVVDHAYHGNLSSLIDLSPYKFNGKGGAGKPAHVEVAAMPGHLSWRLP